MEQIKERGRLNWGRTQGSGNDKEGGGFASQIKKNLAILKVESRNKCSVLRFEKDW